MTDPVPGLLNPYDISPEEKKSIQMQNLWGALLQGGMGLMAAGSRVSDGQRAQLLMQAAQPLANMGAMNQAMMQSASREKLNAAAAQRLAQQDQAMADVRKMADDPAFQEQLNSVLTPAQRAIVLADLKLGKTDSARELMQLASREKLNAAAAQRLAQQDQATAEIRKMADDPAFQGQLSVLNPAMRAIIQADLKLGKTDSARAFLTPRRTEVPSGYRAAGDGLEAIPGGPADPAVTERLAASKRAANEKAIPSAAVNGMQENLTALKKIDATLSELSDPKAKDSVGGVGGWIASQFPAGADALNWVDKDGTKLRAMIADIGSKKLHDRSGANVTISETPRLKPFIPSIGDSPRVIRDKLANLRLEYENSLRDAQDYYNADNGFKVHTPTEVYLNSGQMPPAAASAPQPAAASPQAMPKAGDVIDNHRFKGGNPADKRNWEPLQ